MITTEIPVENYFYLLSYAWDMLKEKDSLKVDFENCPTLNDLYARILCNGFESLIKRGVKKRYQEYSERTSVLKGKISIKNSLNDLMSSSNKLVCEFDDLTYNILENQIIVSTLRSLLYKNIDNDIKKKIKKVLLFSRDIEVIELRKMHFHQSRNHNKHGLYALLINVAEIVYLSGLPTYKNGDNVFRDFINDERELARLFEKFVYNFYRKHLEKHERVGFQKKIDWAIEPMDDVSQKYLPNMNSDILVTNNERKIIIDTKFYKTTFQTNYGKDSIHSGNLYQLQSYVINDKATGERLKRIGLLLYPTVNKHEKLNYKIDNETFIQVQTIDLSKSWKSIEDHLLEIVS